MTTYDFISANKRKSILLIIIFIAMVVGLGWVIDEVYGGHGVYLGIAVIYSVISALVSYYSGDKIALKMSGAKEVTRDDNPYVVRMVENLCIASGTPQPRVHIIDDPAINAFATGRDPEHSSIAVTTGAIEKLENEELEGVLAHELSHIRNYDIRVMTIVIVLVGVITILGDMVFRMHLFGGGRRNNREGGGGIMLVVGLVLMILAPIVAQLIKLAVSRKREFLADASGALLTRYPEGLARALEKISADGQPLQRASGATAHLFIANPLKGKTLSKLFSTHPPVEQRVAALRKMANEHPAS